MKQNTVKFTIGKEGGIALEVMEGQGEDCVKVTQELELHLSRAGSKVDEGKKPEYFEAGPSLDVFNDLT